MPKVAIIAAVSLNGVIGKEGKIPWKIPSDLKRFKKITMGHPVLMGRKTYRSIGKPLPGRMNIVLTRNRDCSLEGCVVVHSFDEAFVACDKNETLFVIGGGEVYREALKYASEFHFTRVNKVIEHGNAFFPEWDQDQWEDVTFPEYSDLLQEGDEVSYTFRSLRRKNLYTTDNARTADQREAMERIMAGGKCNFCLPDLGEEHKKPIIYVGEHFKVTENQWPYPAAKNHILIISKTHVSRLADLPKGAGDELIRIACMLQETYSVKGGAICMRFGDSNLNGASVEHFHVHFLVPDPEKEALFFWIDKKDKIISPV